MCDRESQIPQDVLDGTCYSLQEYFGVHKIEDLYVFRVWAPRAVKVMLTGDFNGWQDDTPLQKIHEKGIWEIFVSCGRITEGSRYKYRIYGCGQVHYKADPYAIEQAPEPDNSSIVRLQKEYFWKDSGWLSYRKSFHKNPIAHPINIYEVHLGSWKKNESYLRLNYRDYARELAPYLKQMGYTHVGLLPIAEYSDNASLGYSPNAFFAPTARYGRAEDFKAFVDKMHEAGIGVLINLPIARFPKERFSLVEFDGAPLYERPCDTDNDGARQFDISKKEVRGFLISNVLYWALEYHVDAICLSGINDMLDSKADNCTDAFNSKEAYFLRQMTRALKKTAPDVLIVADSYNTVKADIDFVICDECGEAIFDYAKIDFENRGKYSFAFTEALNRGGNQIAAVAHPACDRDGRTLIDASSGDYWQKFAGARAILGLMMTLRGKKLLFMGNEIAPFKKWSFERETEWYLLDYESHEKFQRYVAELNNFYLSHTSLWQKDATDESIYFTDKASFKQNIAIFRRSSKSEDLVIVVNLTPTAYEHFRIGAHGDGSFSEVFNSDDSRFYGSGVVNQGMIFTEEKPYHGYRHSFTMRVPPMAISILEFKQKKKKQSK